MIRRMTALCAIVVFAGLFSALPAGGSSFVESEWDKAVAELKKCAGDLPEGSLRKNIEKTAESLASATMADRFKGFRSMLGIKTGSLKQDEKIFVEKAVANIVKVSGRLISDALLAEKKNDRKPAIELLKWLLENKHVIDHKPMLELLGKDDATARAVGASYFEITMIVEGLPELMKAAEKEKDLKALEAELKAVFAYANKIGISGNIEEIKKFIETLKKLREKISNDAADKLVDQQIALLTGAFHRAECKCNNKGKPNKDDPLKTVTCPWCDCISDGEEKSPCGGGAPQKPCKCHK